MLRPGGRDRVSNCQLGRCPACHLGKRRWNAVGDFVGEQPAVRAVLSRPARRGRPMEEGTAPGRRKWTDRARETRDQERCE